MQKLSRQQWDLLGESTPAMALKVSPHAMQAAEAIVKKGVEDDDMSVASLESDHKLGNLNWVKPTCFLDLLHYLQQK